MEFPSHTSQKSVSQLHLLFLQMDPQCVFSFSALMGSFCTLNLVLDGAAHCKPSHFIFLCLYCRDHLFSPVTMVSSKYTQCKPKGDTTTNLLFHSFKFLSQHVITWHERKWHTAQDVNTGGQSWWLWLTKSTTEKQLVTKQFFLIYTECYNGHMLARRKMYYVCNIRKVHILF